MQVRKMYTQNGIKPAAKQLRSEARNSAIAAQLRIYVQSREGDVERQS